MGVHIAIVGSAGPQLEEMVRSCGLKPTLVGGSDLLTLTQPTAQAPDVLLVDTRAAGQMPATLGVVRQRFPAASVVLLAKALDPALMLQAMRAGVNECVAEPITRESLADALTRVLSQRAGVPGELFVFVGAKGGVGTTTLAVNVASAFAAADSTLMIDLHQSYGDASLLFGAEPRFSVMDALENTSRLDPTFFGGLSVPTEAGPVLLASSDQPPSGAVDATRVRLLLDFAVRHYRYTVVDMPRSSPALLDAMESAATIALVTNQELASVRAASQMAERLRRRYGRERLCVVVTRYDRSAAISTDDIEQAVHASVRFTIPSDYRLALQALNVGRPFALTRGTPLADAVASMASTLLGRSADAANTAAATPPGGFLRRLTSMRWTPAVARTSERTS